MEAILLEFLGGRLLDWLPGWLVRRFVSLDSVARQVKVLPRAKAPLNFSLNETTPSVRAWFQVQNHSGVNLVLDRIVTDIWAGQPVVYGVMAYRTRIGKHATTDHIPPFQAALTPAAIDQVQKQRQQQQQTPPIQAIYTMNATGFFDSKVGSFEVQLVGHEADVPA